MKATENMTETAVLHRHKNFASYLQEEEKNNMWAFNSVFYQIYPLGFCGAPFENDGVLTHRILKVKDWIPHMQKLGVDAIYFSPTIASILRGSV